MYYWRPKLQFSFILHFKVGTYKAPELSFLSHPLKQIKSPTTTGILKTVPRTSYWHVQNFHWQIKFFIVLHKNFIRDALKALHPETEGGMVGVFTPSRVLRRLISVMNSSRSRFFLDERSSFTRRINYLEVNLVKTVQCGYLGWIKIWIDNWNRSLSL